jgi:hypothetical protein
MEIRGVPYGDVERIITRVSDERYAGNLGINADAHPLSRTGARARIVAKDSHGPGSRTTWTGRHGPWACWHAYRDVLAAIFAEYPDARIRTRMANYIGRTGFEDLYPATARDNVGSIMQPAYMPDLCGCTESMADFSASAPTVARTIPGRVNYDTNYDNRDTGRMIADIDALLAEVAAEGWTNPYADARSPARRLR